MVNKSQLISATSDVSIHEFKVGFSPLFTQNHSGDSFIPFTTYSTWNRSWKPPMADWDRIDRCCVCCHKKVSVQQCMVTTVLLPSLPWHGPTFSLSHPWRHRRPSRWAPFEAIVVTMEINVCRLPRPQRPRENTAAEAFPLCPSNPFGSPRRTEMNPLPEFVLWKANSPISYTARQARGSDRALWPLN